MRIKRLSIPNNLTSPMAKMKPIYAAPAVKIRPLSPEGSFFQAVSRFDPVESTEYYEMQSEIEF